MRSSSAAALINRNYARLWYGQAISTLGDHAFVTTLVLRVAAVLAVWVWLAAIYLAVFTLNPAGQFAATIRVLAPARGAT